MKQKSILLIVFSLVASAVAAQPVSDNYKHKLSPNLQDQARLNDNRTQEFILAATNQVLFKQRIDQVPTAKIITSYGPAHIITARMRYSDLIPLLADTNLVFVDVLRKPKEEISIAGFDLTVNKINAIHHHFPTLTGNDLTVSVKENRPDTQDIDFKGRYVATPLTSSTFTNHASIMATIIGGGGNSYADSKGVAPGVTITSSSFAGLLPDPPSYYNQYNIAVQNHSYGTGIENYYGADAVAYDASTQQDTSLLHIFSVGNSGTLTPPAGNYAGLPGYANTTGSFKMAKNIVSVGHTNTAGTIAAASSRGPAYDGRLMPQLVAYGEDGSSGAAAITSGLAVLLQQAYQQQHNQLPSSSLIRAVLFNSADDAGPAGIDYQSGYGQVNGYRALQTIHHHQYVSGEVTQGTQQNFSLQVPPGIRQLKVTLTWNDPVAIVNASNSLVNDLDLTVTGSSTWFPWVLSSFPHIDSLEKSAVRRRDSVNNHEQITMDVPAAGLYTINVNGYSVTGTQDFSIAYQLDKADTFQWYTPLHNEKVVAGSPTYIRWKTTIAAPTGDLLYSLDGNTWIPISTGVNLAAGNVAWTPPAINGIARIRLQTLNEAFTSESFIISATPSMQVGFNCADSFLLYWNRIPGAESYQVYELGARYLEPVITTTDTTLVFAKSNQSSLHFTVAPRIQGVEGNKAYTINYTSQGIDCYAKSFLVTLSGNIATLGLSVGTEYEVASIRWEKWINGSFELLAAVPATGALDYTHQDAQLVKGANRYRASIRLVNGTIILLGEETVFFFDQSPYFLYPNPVPQGSAVQLLSRELNDARLQIINATGTIVYETILDDAVKTIPVHGFAKGIYYCCIYVGKERRQVLKLVIF